MEFKELLSLAKSNQSFNQKKFQRDKLAKSKDPKSMVSDSAIKSFMAKKKKIEEQRKTSEEAERRRRIQARLDASLGRKKPSKQSNNTNINVPRRQENSVSKTGTMSKGESQNGPSKAEPKNKTVERISRVSKDKFQIPKKGASNGKQSDQSQNGASGKPMLTSAAKPSSGAAESVKHSFKQHRRRKGIESSFEWSGSAVESHDSSINNSQKVGPKKNRNGTGKTALSFNDLMNVAKQQKDRPAAVKKEDRKKTINDSLSNKDSLPNKEPALRKASGVKGKDIKELRQSNDSQSRGRMTKPNQGKVTTKTVDNRSNYPSSNNNMSAVYRNSKGARLGVQCRLKGDMPSARGRRPEIKGRRPEVGVKRQNTSSLDDELELERRELERKRNMLRKKMQGGLSQGDDYDDGYDGYYDDYDDDEDDFDDFIDDEGEDLDYSKHIRSIFGYDRRRFADEDDDLKDMESNYRQVAAEEARSARIARLEDEIERRQLEMEETKAKKSKRFSKILIL